MCRVVEELELARASIGRGESKLVHDVVLNLAQDIEGEGCVTGLLQWIMFL